MKHVFHILCLLNIYNYNYLQILWHKFFHLSSPIILRWIWWRGCPATHLIIDLINDNTEIVAVSIPAMVEKYRWPRLLGQEGFGFTHSKVLEGFPQRFLTAFKDRKVSHPRKSWIKSIAIFFIIYQWFCSFICNCFDILCSHPIFGSVTRVTKYKQEYWCLNNTLWLFNL